MGRFVASGMTVSTWPPFPTPLGLRAVSRCIASSSKVAMITTLKSIHIFVLMAQIVASISAA